MSKYDALWKYVRERGQAQLILTFDEAEAIAGVPLDHSFLKYKRELLEYGYVQRKRLGKRMPGGGKATGLTCGRGKQRENHKGH